MRPNGYVALLTLLTTALVVLGLSIPTYGQQDATLRIVPAPNAAHHADRGWVYEVVSDACPEGAAGGSPAGNHNGAPDAGEVVELRISLKNDSEKPFLSVSGFLSSEDEYIEVMPPNPDKATKEKDPGEVVYDEIYPDQTVTPECPYRVRIDPACPDGHKAELVLMVWDSGDSPTRDDDYRVEHRFPLEVFNVGPLEFGDAKVDDDVPGPSSGDDDQKMEGGETIEFHVALRNCGTPAMGDITATLAIQEPAVAVTEDTHTYTEIPGGQERYTWADYDFEIAGDSQASSSEQATATSVPIIVTVEASAHGQGDGGGFLYRWQREYTDDRFRIWGLPQPWQRPGTHAGQEVEGPAGITLVRVPGGSFMMGSEDGADDETPVHRVHVSGFWIGKTEVTVAQWRRVMGSVPGNQQGDDHPVVNVSWNDCQEFCEKVGLELPTEAQWEYAARGPEAHRYPWGDTWDEDRLCWRENRGPGNRTFPVGSFPSGASWCGALDMSGNVWEWCADWYDSDYYGSSPTTDPTGPSSGDKRVLRGGSWYSNAGNCRGADRGSNARDNARLNYGFRVARSCR